MSQINERFQVLLFITSNTIDRYRTLNSAARGSIFVSRSLVFSFVTCDIKRYHRESRSTSKLVCIETKSLFSTNFKRRSFYFCVQFNFFRLIHMIIRVLKMQIFFLLYIKGMCSNVSTISLEKNSLFSSVS